MLQRGLWSSGELTGIVQVRSAQQSVEQRTNELMGVCPVSGRLPRMAELSHETLAAGRLVRYLGPLDFSIFERTGPTAKICTTNTFWATVVRLNLSSRES